MQDDIQGIWRLVSFLEQRADGDWEHAIDPAAQGYISYWPNGRMQVLIGGGTIIRVLAPKARKGETHAQTVTTLASARLDQRIGVDKIRDTRLASASRSETCSTAS